MCSAEESVARRRERGERAWRTVGGSGEELGRFENVSQPRLSGGLIEKQRREKLHTYAAG